MHALKYLELPCALYARLIARCARLVMLNVLNNLERILRRKLFWNIEKLRTCTTLSWSHVQEFCTVSKRLKTILN